MDQGLSSTRYTHLAEAKTAKIWATTLIFGVWRLIATFQPDEFWNTRSLDPHVHNKLTCGFLAGPGVDKHKVDPSSRATKSHSLGDDISLQRLASDCYILA